MPNGAWRGITETSGLTKLLQIPHTTFDSALISAFIERWHPETNTFHFPWGEMAPSLHDVYQLLGLKVVGLPVAPSMTDKELFNEVAKMFGMDVEEVYVYKQNRFYPCNLT